MVEVDKQIFEVGIGINELKQLVKTGEGKYLEFKLKSNHPERIIRELVAFSNASGGKLLIGISDDKQIIGLKHVMEDEFILRKSIEKYIYPQIEFKTERVKLVNDREVLVFSVPESKNKPHFVALDDESVDRIAYFRVDDKAVKASKELKEILKGQRKDKSLRFAFGDKEKKLMEYLADHKKVTLTKFAEIANIHVKLASRTLILLVLTNVLKIIPQESADYYELV